jgi:hypothetical protein
MDTTEKIKNALDWADKRLDLAGQKLTKEQRNYVTFALRQNLASDGDLADVVGQSEQLKCDNCLQRSSCMRRAIN